MFSKISAQPMPILATYNPQGVIKIQAAAINDNLGEQFKTHIVEQKDPRFVYAIARAVTADVPNKNHDMFPIDEIKRAYTTFIGRNIFLDHNTKSVRNAVGKIIAAELREDEEGHTYVACLFKVDRELHPDIARKIENGIIDSVSMGANVQQTTCVPPQTKIFTPDGQVMIKDLEVGDYVLTHKGHFKKVTDTFRNPHPPTMIKIHYADGSVDKTMHIERKRPYGSVVDMTPNHPVLMESGEWLPAKYIQPGDKVMCLVNTENYEFAPMEVLSVECYKTTPRTNHVYNIAVEEDESYIAENLVVHNCSICGHSASREADFCDHQKSPYLYADYYAINHGVEFTELSLVSVPADPTAHMHKVFDLRTGINKSAVAPAPATDLNPAAGGQDAIKQNDIPFGEFIPQTKEQISHDTVMIDPNSKEAESMDKLYQIDCSSNETAELIYNILSPYITKGINELVITGRSIKAEFDKNIEDIEKFVGNIVSMFGLMLGRGLVEPKTAALYNGYIQKTAGKTKQVGSSRKSGSVLYEKDLGTFNVGGVEVGIVLHYFNNKLVGKADGTVSPIQADEKKGAFFTITTELPDDVAKKIGYVLNKAVLSSGYFKEGSQKSTGYKVGDKASPATMFKYTIQPSGDYNELTDMFNDSVVLDNIKNSLTESLKSAPDLNTLSLVSKKGKTVGVSGDDYSTVEDGNKKQKGEATNELTAEIKKDIKGLADVDLSMRGDELYSILEKNNALSLLDTAIAELTDELSDILDDNQLAQDAIADALVLKEKNAKDTENKTESEETKEQTQQEEPEEYKHSGRDAVTDTQRQNHLEKVKDAINQFLTNNTLKETYESGDALLKSNIQHDRAILKEVYDSIKKHYGMSLLLSSKLADIFDSAPNGDVIQEALHSLANSGGKFPAPEAKPVEKPVTKAPEKQQEQKPVEQASEKEEKKDTVQQQTPEIPQAEPVKTEKQQPVEYNLFKPSTLIEHVLFEGLDTDQAKETLKRSGVSELDNKQDNFIKKVEELVRSFALSKTNDEHTVNRLLDIARRGFNNVKESVGLSKALSELGSYISTNLGEFSQYQYKDITEGQKEKYTNLAESLLEQIKDIDPTDSKAEEKAADIRERYIREVPALVRREFEDKNKEASKLKYKQPAEQEDTTKIDNAGLTEEAERFANEFAQLDFVNDAASEEKAAKIKEDYIKAIPTVVRQQFEKTHPDAFKVNIPEKTVEQIQKPQPEQPKQEKPKEQETKQQPKKEKEDKEETDDTEEKAAKYTSEIAKQFADSYGTIELSTLTKGKGGEQLGAARLESMTLGGVDFFQILDTLEHISSSKSYFKDNIKYTLTSEEVTRRNMYYSMLRRFTDKALYPQSDIDFIAKYVVAFLGDIHFTVRIKRNGDSYSAFCSCADDAAIDATSLDKTTALLATQECLAQAVEKYMDKHPEVVKTDEKTTEDKTEETQPVEPEPQQPVDDRPPLVKDTATENKQQ